MAGEVVRVEGLDELRHKLRDMLGTLRRRVLRNALAAGAREVRDAARRLAPVLRAGTEMKAPIRRKPGTVRRAIVVRTSRDDKRAGNVGVFVNVRPAKGATFRTVTQRGPLGIGSRKVRVQKRASQRGANSPNDPFYWRFLEFGTRKMAARPFLQPAADRLPQALDKFQTELARWIAKVESSGNPNSN